MKCWNCGTDLDTRNKFYYTDLITEYRRLVIDSIDMTNEWDQGFLDGLNAAREILRESQ